MSLLSQIKGWMSRPAPAPAQPAPAPVPGTVQLAQVDYVEIPEARYEGSYQYWGERSLIPATLQDSIFDATPGVRMELQRRARYWERNSAVMNRLCDLFEQFTVGPNGLRLIPNAMPQQSSGVHVLEDEEDEDALKENVADVVLSQAECWNKAASIFWDEWCQNPEIDSRRCFAETLSLAARSWFIDGEIFLLKTSDRQGRPRVQFIEAHRIGTPTDLTNHEGSQIIDGVEVDAAGTPIAYWVRTQNTSALQGLGNTLYPYIPSAPEEYARIKADQIIHIFEAVRPGLTRGLPFAYPVLNDLHDFEDLQLQEMKATKAAADLAKVWITKTGQAPAAVAANFRRVQSAINTSDAAGNPVTKSAPIYYERTQSGNEVSLKVGEDVKQFLNQRPTAATQWFYDYLLAKICAGCGISKLLVMPYSNQGTVVRSDLDTNARFFLARSAVMQRAAREIYVWVIGWARDWDRKTFRNVVTPPDWQRVIVRPPASVVVDIGRNSAAMLAELAAGVRTRASIWAEEGEDWQEQTEQLFKEAAFLKQMEKKYGVAQGEVLTTPKPATPAPAPAQPAPAKEAKNVNGLLPVNGNGHNRLMFNEKS